MNVYTIEIPSKETHINSHMVIRCPHVSEDGFKCGRQLFRLRCVGMASIEVKCPKCKAVLRITADNDK